MPRKGKCFSTCRSKSKSECDPPECHYTNGNKYKYCRLAFTRKMGPDCVPVLRTTPKRKRTRKTVKPRSPDSIAHNPEDTEMELHPTKESIAEFRAKYAKNAATRKIGRFLKSKKHKIRARFLQSVCSDAGVCIAFGKEAKSIRTHFDNFNNFDLLSKPAERIGAVSMNGFVKELTYEHEGYVANAILKSSADKEADNLLYEALVGFFLNRFTTRFPSFLETYGLYQYAADGLAYTEAKTHKSTNPAVFSAGLQRIASSSTDIHLPIIKQSCTNPISMAVLIQHLKGAETIRKKCDISGFVTNDLLYVLYQVYMTLSSISYIFTHYDLHDENILLYEPVKGKYIEYHYHIDGEEIVFRTKYLAKIIDYGRSYFKELGNDTGRGNSPNFRKILCGLRECDPDCGYDSGFTWLKSEPVIKQKGSFFINSAFPNQSHDLRVFAMLGSNLPGITPELKALFEKVVYGVKLTKANKYFGTVPNTDSGLPDKINNVMDAFTALQELVQDPKFVESNTRYYRGYRKLGELHIYNDGRTPMRYIPE